MALQSYSDILTRLRDFGFSPSNVITDWEGPSNQTWQQNYADVLASRSGGAIRSSDIIEEASDSDNSSSNNSNSVRPPNALSENQRRQQDYELQEAIALLEQKERVRAHVRAPPADGIRITVELPTGEVEARTFRRLSAVREVWAWLFSLESAPPFFTVSCASAASAEFLTAWNCDVVQLHERALDGGLTLHALEADDNRISKCTVCLLLAATTMLPCRHNSFCLKCVEQLQPSICPLCRKAFFWYSQSLEESF